MKILRIVGCKKVESTVIDSERTFCLERRLRIRMGKSPCTNKGLGTRGTQGGAPIEANNREKKGSSKKFYRSSAYRKPRGATNPFNVKNAGPKRSPISPRQWGGPCAYGLMIRSVVKTARRGKALRRTNRNEPIRGSCKRNKVDVGKRDHSGLRGGRRVSRGEDKKR